MPIRNFLWTVLAYLCTCYDHSGDTDDALKIWRSRQTSPQSRPKKAAAFTLLLSAESDQS